MGCKQSKGIQVDDGYGKGIQENLTSPMSQSSQNVSLSTEISNISDPGQRLYQQLIASMDEDDRLLWARVIKICDQDPSAASHIDPITGDTPLHVACRILTAFPFEEDGSITVAPLDAFRVLIRCSADIVSHENNMGYIALHHIIRPLAHLQLTDPSLKQQIAIINLLIASDYESAVEYFSRDDVVFDPNDGACTPIYHVVASVPDDFSNPPGPTVQLVSAIHFPCPAMVTAKNDSNHDKPLALLYRRFTRQFDLSEKFFPGDNSRHEVVEYRQAYKTAAMNTWKIILTLLDPLLDKKKSVSDFYMVHAAVRTACPPDLIRYIIETRPEEVRQTDDQGRLPLHVAAAAGMHQGGSTYHYKFVVDELLYAYPDGAASTDAHNNLPLQLAVQSGKMWIGGGTKSLYDVYPDAMTRVPMEEFPKIRSALSYSTTFVEERGGDDMKSTDMPGRLCGSSGVVKEEHYDAIMMVQKADADLGDVISAMWANEEDGGVQMLGCVAISRLARMYTDDTVMLRNLALTSVTTVVNAMKNHPDEVVVQEKACGALRLLAPADKYREISFAASGAASSIVGAMQAHVSDSIVQKEGCTALRHIVKYGGPERATVIASVSGFTALQNALGAHPHDMDVQREACLTLEAMTSFPDANLPDLPGVQVAPLLEAALGSYPEECGGAAETVLSRLS